MLRELEAAPNKPDGIMDIINNLFDHHSINRVNSFCEDIFNFIGFTGKTIDWPNYFMKESEQNWIEHEAPVDDL